jgi:hypothetical protein
MALLQYSKFFTVVVIFFFLFNNISAQSDFKNYGTIYEKDGYKIDLLIKLNKSACTKSNKSSRYQFDVKLPDPKIAKKNDNFLNFIMDVIECDGFTVTKNISLPLKKLNEGINKSLDWEFPGDEIDSAFHDVTISLYPNTTKDIRIPRSMSISADRISGNPEIQSGQISTLSVIGGKLMEDAKWVWYEGSIDTKPIDYGQTINVSPKTTKTYYLRAEGLKYKTPAISFQVVINDLSTPAKSIDGNEKICANDFKPRILKCIEGKLGKGAKWIWYKNEIKEQNKIGEGIQIEVNTQTSTKYLVRAEGIVDTSEAVSLNVSIFINSTSPISINGKNKICYGESLTLTPNGGSLASDAKWMWYSKQVGNNSKQFFAEGNSITISPKIQTEYFLQASGFCNITEEISSQILVTEEISNPLSIIQNTNSSTTKILSLELVESIKSSNTNFVWYKGTCGENKIGEGKSINYESRKGAQIFVRAESDCGNSPCISTTVLPRLRPYSGGFINFGLVGGDKPDVSIGMITLAIKSIYFRVKMNTNILQQPQTTDSYQYETTDAGVVNYPSGTNSYYKFNGTVTNKRTAYTIGYVTKGRNAKIYFGAGYGTYEQQWGLDIYNSTTNQKMNSGNAKNIEHAFKGAEIEAGLLIRFGPFNILGGVSTIIQQKTDSQSVNQFVDAHAGFGFSF